MFSKSFLEKVGFSVRDNHHFVLDAQVILVEFLSVYFPLVFDFFRFRQLGPLGVFQYANPGSEFSLDILNFHIACSGSTFQVFLFHFYAHPLVVSFFAFPYSSLKFPADHIGCLQIATGFGCSPFVHNLQRIFFRSLILNLHIKNSRQSNKHCKLETSFGFKGT